MPSPQTRTNWWTNTPPAIRDEDLKKYFYDKEVQRLLSPAVCSSVNFLVFVDTALGLVQIWESDWNEFSKRMGRGFWEIHLLADDNGDPLFQPKVKIHTFATGSNNIPLTRWRIRLERILKFILTFKQRIDLWVILKLIIFEIFCCDWKWRFWDTHVTVNVPSRDTENRFSALVQHKEIFLKLGVTRLTKLFKLIKYCSFFRELRLLYRLLNEFLKD